MKDLKDCKTVSSSIVPTYSKVTGSIPDSGGCVFIMNVLSDHYVPHGVKVRFAISSTLFTGTCHVADIATLNEDKNVASIAISAPLHLVE